MQNTEKSKILIVDDRQKNLDVLTILLEDFNADLFEANSGNKALELTLKHDFALILMDVQMPGMDGYETARILISRIKTPIIFITAHRREKRNIVEGYESGAVDFLVKPIDSEVLKNKVNVFLLLHQQKCLLKHTNKELKNEIQRRHLVEQDLIQARNKLEERVNERTLDLKKAYEKLQESENNIHLVINNIPVMIAFVDKDRRFVYANKQCEQFVNSAENMVGQHIETEIGARYIEELRPHIDSVLAGDKVEFEFEVPNLERQNRHLSIVAIPRTINGTNQGFFVLMQDITGQKAEAQKKQILEAQFRQLRQLKSMATLSGGVAHEFNNLLVPIIGFSKMVKNNLPPDSQDAGYLSRVLNTAYRAKDIVAQVKLFSRKQEIAYDTIQLDNVVRQVTNEIQETLPKTIELKIELEHDMPSIVGNAKQLEQVLQNLYKNSVEAMPNGGILRVTLYTCESGKLTNINFIEKDLNLVCLTLEDTGHGMDGETRRQIFNPFFTTKEKGTHSGLGLSVVLGIVEQHDGTIETDTKQDKGFSLSIYFPAAGSHISEKSEPELKSVLVNKKERISLDDEESIIRR